MSTLKLKIKLNIMNFKILLVILGLYLTTVPVWGVVGEIDCLVSSEITAVTEEITQITPAVKNYPLLAILNSGQIENQESSGENANYSEGVSPQWCIEDILPFRLEVDYSRIIAADTDVLMFGETHNIAQGKQELVWNMHLFKELGFTHIGLEMFTTDVQFMLDEFNRTGENRAEVLRYLYGQWGYPDMVENYMEILDVARAEGIQVVALDMPTRQQDNYVDFTEQLTARNEYMSRIISGILKQEGNRRIITLNGALHLEGMSALMRKNYEINVTSVAFTGGKKSEFDKKDSEAETSIESSAVGFAERNIPDFDILYANALIESAILEAGRLIENAARGIGICYTRFMVKVNGNGGLAPCCDWFIHLPQTE